MESEAHIVGYGGSPGGGKTELALGLAITQHRKSRIFRAEYTQHKDMIERSREIIGERGNFNGSSPPSWRNLPGNRSIEFAACNSFDNAQKKWKGRPADLLVFDEATEIPESVVRFLMGWNRTTIKGQRCRVVLTFNPPTTPEGQWIISFFAPWLDKRHPKPAKHGELRWFAMVDGKEVERPNGEAFWHQRPDGEWEKIEPRSRTFIPAKLSDNPILAATDYNAQLQALPEPLRSQMLYGDFSIGVKDDEWQVIPTAWVEKTPKPQYLKDGKMVDVPLSALGVDPSRGGAAETVIAPRYDNWFAPLISYQGEDTSTGPKVGALVLRHWADDAVINIDAIGIGTSATDWLKSDETIPVNAINAAQPCKMRDKSGKFRLVNIRTAMYWKMREALDPDGGDNICLPDDPQLKADLCAPRYKVTAEGIAVEPKHGHDGVKGVADRLGRSPDRGDAVVMANWQGGIWFAV
jgi:phage terminase large subunit-like protein